MPSEHLVAAHAAHILASVYTCMQDDVGAGARTNERAPKVFARTGLSCRRFVFFFFFRNSKQRLFGVSRVHHPCGGGVGSPHLQAHKQTCIRLPNALKGGRNKKEVHMYCWFFSEMYIQAAPLSFTCPERSCFWRAVGDVGDTRDQVPSFEKKVQTKDRIESSIPFTSLQPRQKKNDRGKERGAAHSQSRLCPSPGGQRRQAVRGR